jgi:hypothetical protein
MSELSELDDEILFRALLSLDVFGTSKRKKEPWTRVLANRAAGNRPSFEFVNFGAAYDPSEWTETAMGAAQAKAWSRSAAKLETEGLIECERPAGRLRFFRLTALGLAKALDLYPECDRSAVKIGLRATEWATPEMLDVLKGKPPKQPAQARQAPAAASKRGGGMWSAAE